MGLTERETTGISEPGRLPERIKSGVRDYVGELKMFSRNVRLYLSGLFLIWVNFQIFILLLNLYLKELGYPEGDIGWVNSSRAIGMSLMALPIAMLINRIRLKPLLLAGCALLAVFSFGMSTFSPLFAIMAFSILSGMTLAVFRVAAGPFFMRNSTPKERTLVFSTSFAVNVLAGMVASAGSGNLVNILTEKLGDPILGYRYTLYGGIALSFLAFIPLAMIKAADPSAEESPLSFSWSMLKARRRFYFKVSFVNFLVGMGAGLIIPFLNLYFQDRFHLGPATIGWFFFFVTFSMFVGVLVGPVLTKRFGLVRTVVFTELLSIPFMFILSYSYFLPLAFIAFVMRGGLMNMGAPLVTNFAMELCDKHEQGLVNALLMLTWTSSWMVSTAIGGWMIEAEGYTFTLNITIVLYVVSALVYFQFFRRAEQRKKNGKGYDLVAERAV